MARPSCATWRCGRRLPPLDDATPRTLFEKIVDRHTLASPDTPARLAPGQGGFVRADLRFIHEYYTGMCAHMLDHAFGDGLALHQPHSIVAFEDHLPYVHQSPVHVAQGLIGGVQRLSRAHRGSWRATAWPTTVTCKRSSNPAMRTTPARRASRTRWSPSATRCRGN